MNTTTCFAPAHILLPAEQIPLEQWGCIACDQFTSDREYWQRAKEAADGSPSTLNLILPEVYLEDGNADARVEQIHATMADYAQNVLTRAVDGFVYVERTEQSGRGRPCGHGGSGSLQLSARSKVHRAAQREHGGEPHPAPHEGAHRCSTGNAPHHDAGR